MPLPLDRPFYVVESKIYCGYSVSFLSCGVTKRGDLSDTLNRVKSVWEKFEQIHFFRDARQSCHCGGLSKRVAELCSYVWKWETLGRTTNFNKNPALGECCNNPALRTIREHDWYNDANESVVLQWLLLYWVAFTHGQ